MARESEMFFCRLAGFQIGRESGERDRKFGEVVDHGGRFVRLREEEIQFLCGDDAVRKGKPFGAYAELGVRKSLFLIFLSPPVEVSPIWFCREHLRPVDVFDDVRHLFRCVAFRVGAAYHGSH